MRFIFFFIILFSAFSAFSQSVKVEIIQSGKKVKTKQESILLEKNDFEFVISFSKRPEKAYEIYLNLSYEDKYFEAADSDSAPEAENLLFYTIAEIPFNHNKKIYVDLEAFHFLGPTTMHKGIEKHNFDTLIQKSDKFIGIRKVRYFDDRKKGFSVKEIEKPLYLYIVAFKKDNNSRNSLENLKNENVCFRLHKKIIWK
jgi:hypothetical protein